MNNIFKQYSENQLDLLPLPDMIHQIFSKIMMYIEDLTDSIQHDKCVEKFTAIDNISYISYVLGDMFYGLDYDDIGKVFTAIGAQIFFLRDKEDLQKIEEIYSSVESMQEIFDNAFINLPESVS